MAMPVYVNLALHGSERVARAVQTGLLRLVREKLAAMRTAEYVLRSELRGQLTGVLLNSELALRDPSLSEAVSEKIQAVHDLAETIRFKLESAQAGAPDATAHISIPSNSQHELRPHGTGCYGEAGVGTLRYGGCSVSVVPTPQRTR